MSRKSEKRRPGERAVQSGGGAGTGKIILLGSLVLLLGIGAMIALRANQLGEDSPDGPDTSSIDTDPDTSTENQTPDKGAVTIDNQDAPVETTDTSPPDNIAPKSGVKDEIDTDRGRKALAAINDVATQMGRLAEDNHGVIVESLRDGIVAELERCRLTQRAGDIEPLLTIELAVKQTDEAQTLWMSAELIAKDGDEKIRVWARSGSVAPISNQALSAGILPPNFSRDVANFFRTLRADFIDARRQFGS